MTPSRAPLMMLEMNGSVCLRLASNSGVNVWAWAADISDATLPVSNLKPKLFSSRQNLLNGNLVRRVVSRQRKQLPHWREVGTACRERSLDELHLSGQR